MFNSFSHLVFCSSWTTRAKPWKLEHEPWKLLMKSLDVSILPNCGVFWCKTHRLNMWGCLKIKLRKYDINDSFWQGTNGLFGWFWSPTQNWDVHLLRDLTPHSCIAYRRVERGLLPGLPNHPKSIRNTCLNRRKLQTWQHADDILKDKRYLKPRTLAPEWLLQQWIPTQNEKWFQVCVSNQSSWC